MSGDYLPPYSDDAEQAVLAAMLMDPAAIEAAAKTLDDGLGFFVERHRILYREIQALHRAGTSIDPITLSNSLARLGQLEAVGGKDYIAYLIDAVPTAANVEYHAAIIREKWDRRTAISHFQHALDRLAAERDAVEEIATSTQSWLATIGSHTSAGPKTLTLAELWADPDLMRTPECIIPRTVWAARVTFEAAREKEGKSTKAGFLAALASKGGVIYGQPIPERRVLHVALEEHPGDVAHRYRRLNAKPENIDLLFDVPNGLDSLERAIAATKPDYTLVDTLSALTEGMIEDPHNSAAWTPIMQRITRMARKYGTGIHLLGHARKSDGRYRDSTAIGAGVDMILETIADGDGTSFDRKVIARGRWALPNYTVRYDPVSGLFDVVEGGETPIEFRVHDWIRANPGGSLAAVRRALGGNAQKVDAAVQLLEDRGLVRNDPKGSTNRYYDQTRSDKVADKVGVTASSETDKPRQGSDKGQTTSGQPLLVPDPNPLGSGDKGSLGEAA